MVFKEFFHAHINLHDEFNELILSHTLQAISLSLVGIFIPIFFLEIGFNLKQVIFYLGLFQLGYLIHIFLAKKLVKKIGVKHLMLSRGLSTVLNLSLIKLVEYKKELIYVLIFTQGMSMYYWIPLHHVFAKNSNKKNMKKHFIILKNFKMFGKIIGPLLGAVIINTYGFQALFTLAIILLLISTTPMLLSKDKKVKVGDSNLKSLFKIKFFRRVITEGYMDYFKNAILPIIVFLTLQTRLEVGYLGSLTNVIYIIGLLIVTKIKNKNIYQILALLGLAISINLYFNKNLTNFVITVILLSVYSVTMQTTQSLKFYKLVRKRTKDIITREVALHGGIAIVLLLISLVPEQFVLQSLIIAIGFLQLLVI